MLSYFKIRIKLQKRWVRSIINDGDEATERKSQARFQNDNIFVIDLFILFLLEEAQMLILVETN